MESLAITNKDKCVLLVMVAGVSASGMSRTIRARLYTNKTVYDTYSICELLNKKPTKNGLIRVEGAGTNAGVILANEIAKKLHISDQDIIIETF